jgi:hypothetical protein
LPTVCERFPSLLLRIRQIGQNVELAKRVARQDDGVDQLYQELFAELIVAMVRGELPVEGVAVSSRC